MPHLTIPVLQAFVDGDRGGNPAAVVLDADAYNSATRQAIATRVGLSETAFVSGSPMADYRLEYFTPVRPIAQCGHATIAAFSYLARLGRLPQTSSMETVDGVRAIRLEGEQAFMEQRAPTFTRPESQVAELNRTRLLASLRLDETELLDGLEPLVVNTGNSFLLVPLRSATAVRQLEPDLEAIGRISQQLGLVGYYVFSPEASQPTRDAGARMFGPYYGIPEEAATGMAAGPLAAYLYTVLKQNKTTFCIEQGHLMSPPSPSVLTARLRIEEGTVTSLWVGGRATPSYSVTITLPDA